MSISLFFGLPGCGKTTLMSSFALRAVKEGKYRNVYSNVKMSVPGVTFITNDCIGKYGLYDSLILIDEASLFADSRDFKSFDEGKKTFFLLHRHFRSDVFLFTQQWDAVDRKIRVITDKVYYVYKPFLFGAWFTKYYRIPYGIIIPDPKKGTGSPLGEIIQGYCKPNFLIRLFCPYIFRPALYKYFDSWELPPGFPPLPSRYKPFYKSVDDYVSERSGKPKRTLTFILLRSFSKIRSTGQELIHRAAHFFSSVFHKQSPSK